ncbi:hypothetical protein BCR44DRAFT_1178287 [Catenaria anguillulae PL171]|uniref:Uncharacterized protein n=1 Tax=Catenaria anguillulae PL171 TaxID=765915 RepID=A0A1Y2HKK4_9FUNG|nr:hypothetical protein BCR44DRAFT_1178287 [Catenaria anguillulae PL171]
METVPSIAATSSGQVNDFANIPVQVDFLGGKGTIIDSSISIPSGQLRLKDGLLWVHVSSSHNVLLPSAVELFRSLMDAPQSTRARTETSSTLGGLLSPMPLSPMPATPRSETMPDMHSTSANGGGGGGGASLPFQVLFVLEPTTIDLKGRKSKCLAQLQFSSTVHVDPAPLHVSVLVPTLSFGIHHPFASEDCVTMRINDITFAYGLDSGLLGQVPSVELKVLLRHFLEIREWIDEWTAHAPLSSMTTTAPPESPSASRNSRQFLTEPLPSPLGTSMRSSMQFDSAPFDFPHSLIKFGKVEATIQMGQAIGLATVTLPDLFMFAEHRTAHFSSNLAVAVNGRVLSRLDMRSFHATLQFQGHQTMVEAGIERILGTFQYQTAMTTVADVATVGILLVARGLSADLDIRVGDSVLLTSARAAPAVLNVMQRFKDLVGLSASPSTTPAAPLLSPFGD